MSFESADWRYRRRHSVFESLSAGACDSPGRFPKMEDKHNLLLDVSEEHPTKKVKHNVPENPVQFEQKGQTPISFFLVCDGHGGDEVANYVNDHLPENIVNQIHFRENPQAAILQGFIQTELELQKMCSESKLDGGIGTTAAVAIIVGNEMFLANIGDTEIILCSNGKLHVLSEIHRLSNENERKRVEEVGGRVLMSGVPRLGHPVWNPKLVNIGLTRSIGDFYFKDEEWIGDKKSGLIATPDVAHWKLTTDDEFMVIASDGFWDVVEKEECIRFVKMLENLDNDSICGFLISLAQSRNSKDNLTVLIVNFRSRSVSGKQSQKAV